MLSQDAVRKDLERKRSLLQGFNGPRFDWGAAAIQSNQVPTSRVRLHAGNELRPVDLAHLADLIGCALSDLLHARQEADIFTEANRRTVATLASAVHESLERRAASDLLGSDTPILSEAELTQVIQQALVRNQQFDLAKSLIDRHRGALLSNEGNRSTVELSSQPKMPKLVRRNGIAVPWRQDKVEIALNKAFLSVKQDPTPARLLSQSISERFVKIGQEFVHIEEVQDAVQEELMRGGHFKVAEHFILYRSHRAAIRAEEAAAQAQHEVDSQQIEAIEVVNEDGSSEFWTGQDLRRRIDFAMLGLNLVLSRDQIDAELRRSLFNGIKTSDLEKVIILNAKTLIEKDADFAKFAGRIALTYIYEEVLDWSIVRDGVEKLKEAHRAAFKINLTRGVKIGRINKAMLEMDLEALAESLDPMSDLEFDYLGIQTLYDRYLITDKTAMPHRRLETPQLFWMRVSMGLFLKEPVATRTREVTALYQLYRTRRFCSSTPTLFNSGTNHSQLSSCYLYKVDDSIESIMYRGIAENAFLSKFAGGLGGSWTAVRGTGSHIHGTNGESQGVIPFLKLHNDQLIAVNQGGKRRGSGCAYLESWHLDIFEFLKLRISTGDHRRLCHDMNTANWIPDLFMKRMEGRQDWTLFRSNEVADLHETYGAEFERRYVAYEEKAARGEIFGKTVPAIELWKDMLKMVFETGHPWITFKDPCNLRSPQDHCGVIHSSNLCTEITLNTSEEETAVCNLGSVVLENHLLPNGEIDHPKLRETIRIAVRALDNVIDINFYPTKPAETANMRHRPIGMGVMGLANALFQKGLAFASSEAVDFNDELMEAVSYYAYEASSDLAAERGAYSSYKGSKWDRGILPQDTIDLLEAERGEKIECPRGGKMDWTPLRAKIAKQGMRNSNVLAIAPTATISNIMGSSPCIEPHPQNLYVKANLSGDFTVHNEFLCHDLKKLGLWDQNMVNQLKYYDGELKDIESIPQHIKDKYKTAFSIDYHWLIQAAARRQKWIDQSQSLNLFLAVPDLKTLSHMYRAAWRAGLKTTYYLRTLQASNIEKATIELNKDKRGVIAGEGQEAQAKTFTAEQKMACSIDAMMNGGTCEACQ